MTATHTENRTSSAGEKPPCNCGCSCGKGHAQEGCCSLLCFERPNYFCGHLLTDEDLSLELRYVIEKNKLRNRSLVGEGVVCGLQLTCNEDCEGSISVARGYAVDCCGNDLVVCEQQRVEVVEILRKKKLLVGSPPQDPCSKKVDEPDCKIEQCFYVVACYRETSAEYTTPFQAGCGTGPAACLPTRIRESAEIDIVTEMPEIASYEERLIRHIRNIYSVFTEGTLGTYMKTQVAVIRAALEEQPAEQGQSDFYDVFCTMRAYFLHFLKEYPDPMQCSLYHDVRDLVCPRNDGNRQASDVKACFDRIIVLMQEYQYDRLRHALAFACREPAKNCCVVLGTVELLGGRLRRVCHTPRRYTWSAANLVEVAVYELLSGIGRKSRSDNGERREGETMCCGSYEIDSTKFLDQFDANRNARRYAAEAPVLAFGAMRDALRRAFDFTDSDALSPRTLSGLEPQVLEAVARRLNLNLTMSDSLSDPGAPTPFQTMSQSVLLRSGYSVTGSRHHDKSTVSVISSLSGLLSPYADSVHAGTGGASDFDTLRRQLEESRAQVQSAQTRLDEISGKLAAMKPEDHPQ